MLNPLDRLPTNALGFKGTGLRAIYVHEVEEITLILLLLKFVFLSDITFVPRLKCL
jgi:hypothetical protein